MEFKKLKKEKSYKLEDLNKGFWRDPLERANSPIPHPWYWERNTEVHPTVLEWKESFLKVSTKKS